MATKEGYIQVTKNYMDGIRKAKVDNDLRLARDSKSNNKNSILQVYV